MKQVIDMPTTRKTNRVRFAVIKARHGQHKIYFVRQRGEIKTRVIRWNQLKRINRLIENHPAKNIITNLTTEGQETELYNK